jgi:hypothetical protein
VSADAGLLVQAGQDWRAGISFLQFGGGSPDSGKASFWPVTIQVGSGYRFSPQLYVIGFIEKTRAQPLVLQGALLYQLVSSFQLRGGYSWPLAAGWMGAGWTSGKLDCHLIFHLHPQLGLTPALTVQYRFSKKGL